MKIFLRTLDCQIFMGKIFALEVNPTSSVTTIKANIHDLVNVPIEDMKLFFSGKLLEDGLRLSNCNIPNESTLVLALKSKGRRLSPYGIEGIKKQIRKHKNFSDGVSEQNRNLVAQNYLLSKR